MHGFIWTVMSINFQNISLLVWSCMTYWQIKVCSGCMDLFGPTSINFENISLLVSGCMDLLANKSVDCHFVLRLNRPIRLPFCAQATRTYMITIFYSGCMDLDDLDYKHFMSINFENIWLLVSGCMDLLANKKCAQAAWTYLDCHFVLRLHGPIWSPFCAHVAQTYKIAIMCSGNMDLYDCHFVLRSHGSIQLVVWSAFCTQVT